MQQKPFPLPCLLFQSNRVHSWNLAVIKNSNHANWVKYHTLHIFSSAQQPRVQARLLHLWGRNTRFSTQEYATGSCGHAEEPAGEGCARLSITKYRRKGKIERANRYSWCSVILVLHILTCGSWWRTQDKTKHTYQCCEGKSSAEHPLGYPPHHLHNPWGPSVRGLQQQHHSRCAHRFLRGAK